MPGRHRNVVLDVTESDIEGAVRRDSSHCVIADTIGRSLEVTRISVDLQTIRFTDSKAKRRYIYLTPPAAQLVILGFDQGVRPTPQKIRLGRPIQTVSVGRQNRDPKRIRVTEASPHSHGVDEVEIEGGHAIPQGALSSSPRKGRKRVFGLKQLTP